MKNNKLLIAGIDPGTTTAYSIIDLEGNLIKLESSKNLGINSLIQNIVKEGKVILVGTDKAKIPSLVYNFAAKLGAKIIHPEEDLKIFEKRELTKNFKTNNEHENDALASSLFTFNELKPLFEKIDNFIIDNKKFNLREKIAELVISKGISIKNAADILEKPETEESQIIKKVVEEKKLLPADFFRLYNKVKMYEKEIMLLKRQNNKLNNEAKHAENKYKYLEKKMFNSGKDKKVQEIIDFKEQRIKHFSEKLALKEKEILSLKEYVNKFEILLSNINQCYLVKKLDNLGSAEFERKGRILNMGKGDILLVNEPNIVSEKVLENLKEKVEIILHKNPISNKIKDTIPFIFINSKNIAIFETINFGIVKKEVLDKEIEKSTLLSKIINEYKKERENN